MICSSLRADGHANKGWWRRQESSWENSSWNRGISTKKEVPLGTRFNNSLRGDAKGEYRKEVVSVEFSLAELVQYLRQCLHDSVQQRSHSHRHLQEFQYCRCKEETKGSKSEHIQNSALLLEGTTLLASSCYRHRRMDLVIEIIYEELHSHRLQAWV